MNRYISYLRVSSSEQGKSGLGLEAQAAMIAEFIAREGGELIGTYEDVMTGADDARPELQKARRAARKAERKGAPVFIVVAKLDRLSRRMSFIASAMEGGIKFVTCDLGHDVDPFVLHLYAALAEKERALIGARTRQALAALKARGVRLGKPENFDDAGRQKGAAVQAAQAVKVAQGVMPTIAVIQARGVTKLQAIADELNFLEIPTARGGEWHKTSVARILKRVA